MKFHLRQQNMCHAVGARLCRFILEELLRSDIKGVKCIRSVGAVFQQILFRLGVLCIAKRQSRALLIRLVLAEAKATTIHLCGLNGENEVIVLEGSRVFAITLKGFREKG